MRVFKLPCGAEAIVDDDDFDRLSKYKWRADRRKNTTYAARGGKLGPKIFMHRQIMIGVVGHIDHINLNGLDNRKSNLREISASQNVQNSRMRSHKKYGKYKGSHYSKTIGRWLAKIKKDRKQIYLGCFKTEIEAAIAYNVAARELFGPLAYQNKIEDI